MSKRILIILVLALLPGMLLEAAPGLLPAGYAAPDAETSAQRDTLPADRQDSLDAAQVSGRQAATYMPKAKVLREEVITGAGLCKMACCNLAESFENSASVTVGYADAVTGARQIRLLGLSGAYTQLLDENRPVARGVGSPFGLSFFPGQWLESIQIAKGSPSVINGLESMTGQINLEHRKPTDEIPLFVNASVMADTKADLNVASSLQMGNDWSTALLGHVSGNFRGMDHNRDGFLDDPLQFQLNLANRWLYYAPSGVQVRFGLKFLYDTRRGGEIDGKGGAAYRGSSYVPQTDCPWGTDIVNRNLGGYLKVGIPLNEENSRNIAAVLDLSRQKLEGHFGAGHYVAGQSSAFLNLLYQDQADEQHHFTLGAGGQYDRYDENLLRLQPAFRQADEGLRRLASGGLFGEYTFHYEEKLTLIAGLRQELFRSSNRTLLTRTAPRLPLRYSPFEDLVLRANAGRGLRYASPLTDYLGVLSTGKRLEGNFAEHSLEDSWIAGGNLTFYLPEITDSKPYISLDFFHTRFTEQKIVDYERRTGSICFYDLSSIPGGQAYTNTLQADFSIEPLEGLTFTLTGRYTDARVSLLGRGLVEKPMTSRYKAVFNLQYATRLNRWIFDFTASLNGPCRVYDFMKDRTDASGALLYPGGRTPVYPLLYLQVTRRWKGLDVYVGGENLTNFRQKEVIIGSRDASGRINPVAPDFDASCVWGPLAGIKVYAGVRFTLWK